MNELKEMINIFNRKKPKQINIDMCLGYATELNVNDPESTADEFMNWVFFNYKTEKVDMIPEAEAAVGKTYKIIY